MRHPWVVPSLAVAAGYVAASEAARLGLRYDGDMAIVSLTSAVGLAALLLRGAQVLPGVAAGIAAVTALGGKPLPAALLEAAVSAAQVLLGWLLLTRVWRISSRLDHVHDVLGFTLIGAAVMPAIGAVRSLGGGAAETIGMSLLGETAGVLLLAPALLTWLAGHDRVPRAGRRTEAALLYAATAAVAVTVFHVLLGPMMNAASLPYALFPLAFWAAFRFGPRETAAVVLLAGAVAVYCHAVGTGPFIRPGDASGVAMADFASLYLFLTTLSVTALLVAAAQRQRDAAETQVRHSEQQYRSLIERMSEGVNITNADANMVFVSDRFCEMTGYAREELIGRKGSMLTVLEQHPEWEETHRRRRAGLAESHALTLRRKSGELLHAWISPRPMHDEAGRYVGSLNVVLDMTAQRRAEDQARQHLQQLAHVSRVASLGEMASAIAHEINQPLTAIANYASACLRLVRAGRIEGEATLQAMQRIAAEAERAGEVVRKMRGFVRGEEGQLAPVDAGYLVTEVLRLASPEARQAGVSLAFEGAAGLPRVLADSIQIQQVLLNLVRNAIEAIAAAGAERREITLSSQQAQADFVEITVRDTGPGIAPERAEKVFEPFYTTKADGIGIGLALSRSIVDAHGGRLWVEPGSRGALFHLTLPVAPEVQHAGA